MIQLQPEPDMLKIVATGTLTGDDYDRFVPAVERFIGERGPLRLYIQLEDFSGWSPGGLWKDVKFDVRHQDDMERIAVVGEPGWEEWGTKLAKPFFRADMKFFEPDHADEAEEWLRA